ncbi:MAG: hypothetical protein CL955_06375 [Erythrobacteraceae bacterium]|nr:hypothetical protein [Erythrobacteraceae bacterium]
MASALLMMSIGCSGESGAAYEVEEYELENKHEYSILESEYYSREGGYIYENFIPVSKFDPEYRIAIIKIIDDQYKFAALLLNPRHPPFEKSFPVTDLEIPDEIKVGMQPTSN